jgi:hypothetical protein
MGEEPDMILAFLRGMDIYERAQKNIADFIDDFRCCFCDYS